MTRNEDKSGDSKYQKKTRRREKHKAKLSRDHKKKGGAEDGFSDNYLESLKEKLLGADYQMTGVNVTTDERIEKIAKYH